MVLISIAIRLGSKGPVLFTQERAGFQGRPFRLRKFRTLKADADPTNADITHLNERDGPAFKMKNDPRATTVGRWLRVSALDELPQFWNVLKGDMSLVGPRPLPVHEMAACEEWHLERLAVLPGLTCFWQLHDQEVSFDEWMRMDIQYIESMGPFVDLKLLALTPMVILRRICTFGGKRG